MKNKYIFGETERADMSNRPASVSNGLLRALAKMARPPQGANLQTLKLWHRLRTDQAFRESIING